MNASAEVIEAMRQRLQPDEEVEPQVWPQHWHAVNVFAGMATQWRVVAGMAGLLYLGLDYAALQPVLQEHEAIAHAQPMRQLMPQLRTLESAAREELNRS